MMKKFAFTLLLAFFSFAHTEALGQISADPLRLYPLHKGNLWQYTYYKLISPHTDTTVITIEVVADTTLPNGSTYAVLSGDLIWYITPELVRVDTTQGILFTAMEDRFTGWADEPLFWLSASEGSPPGLSDSSRFVPPLDATRLDQVFGQERVVADGGFPGHFEGPSYRFTLAEGIGLINVYGFNGGPLEIHDYRLVYARINGQTFGTPVSVHAGEEVGDRVVFNASQPNPFTETTSLMFTLRERALVRLTVYDMMGREVAVLIDTALEAGPHVVRWEAAVEASGGYMAELRVDDERKTHLMIKAR